MLCFLHSNKIRFYRIRDNSFKSILVPLLVSLFPNTASILELVDGSHLPQEQQRFQRAAVESMELDMDAAMSEQAESRRSSAAAAAGATASIGGIVIPGRPLSKIRRGL